MNSDRFTFAKLASEAYMYIGNAMVEVTLNCSIIIDKILVIILRRFQGEFF